VGFVRNDSGCQARNGIDEPMCRPIPVPPDWAHFEQIRIFERLFRTVDWNRELFRRHGLSVTESYYFEEGDQWWVDNLRYHDGEKELILQDGGRWLSLGLVVGEKT